LCAQFERSLVPLSRFVPLQVRCFSPRGSVYPLLIYNCLVLSAAKRDDIIYAISASNGRSEARCVYAYIFHSHRLHGRKCAKTSNCRNGATAATTPNFHGFTFRAAVPNGALISYGERNLPHKTVFFLLVGFCIPSKISR